MADLKPGLCPFIFLILLYLAAVSNCDFWVSPLPSQFKQIFTCLVVFLLPFLLPLPCPFLFLLLLLPPEISVAALLLFRLLVIQLAIFSRPELAI